jgi:hypothetical protein
MHQLEILDPTGHLILTWDPDDETSVTKAREEFDRLKGCGFAFFLGDEDNAPRVTALKEKALEHSGELVIKTARTFNPQAKRTVAVRPMRGG